MFFPNLIRIAWEKIGWASAIMTVLIVLFGIAIAWLSPEHRVNEYRKFDYVLMKALVLSLSSLVLFWVWAIAHALRLAHGEFKDNYTCDELLAMNSDLRQMAINEIAERVSRKW